MERSNGDTPLWQRFTRVGGDLTVIIFFAIVIGAIQTSLLEVPEPIRIVTGLPFLFLLPGYALIAALFPRSRPILARSPDAKSTFFGRFGETESDEARTTVRLTLSLAASVAVVSLLGIVLGTAASFTPGRLAVGLTSITVACSVVAVIRRLTLPSDERYAPALISGLARLLQPIGQGSRFGRTVQAVVIVSLLLSMGTAAYAVSVPQQGETPTEMYLLSENEAGELTTEGYPQMLRPNEEQTLFVGVTNQEQTRQKFTVVVTLDRVVSTGNSSLLIERAEITRFSRPLSPGQWWQQRYEIEPLLNGSNLRLTHHLYRGEAPSEVDSDEAYRVTYLWLSGPDNTPSTNESAQATNETTLITDESVQSTNDSAQSDSESPQSGDESTDSDTDLQSGDGSTDSDTDLQSGDGSTDSDTDSQSSDGNTTSDSEPTGSDSETTPSDIENEQSFNESAS